MTQSSAPKPEHLTVLLAKGCGLMLCIWLVVVALSLVF
jgi:hypothetical protein